MGDTGILFPEPTYLRSFSPPVLAPIEQVVHRSKWTGRTFVYTYAAVWSGKVWLRRFSVQQEAATDRFNPVLFNMLVGQQNTFDLQLPLPTLPLRSRGTATYALDAASQTLRWTPQNKRDLNGTLVGQFCSIGGRVYQVWKTQETAAYLIPDTIPPADAVPQSLKPSASAEARLRAHITSHTMGQNDYNELEGPFTFTWEEVLQPPE